MSLLNKTEKKIFITTIIVFTIFLYWNGYDEEARFALTRSIVEEHSLNIDTFANQTLDWIYFNSHYHPDKEPGVSLFALPVFSAWKLHFEHFVPYYSIETYNSEPKYYLDPNNRVVITNTEIFTPIARILVTWWSSTLPSALLAVIFFRLLGLYTKKERTRFLTTFVLMFGTLIFHHSITFVEYLPTTFLLFLSFYLMKKSDKKRDFVLAGLFCGLAVVFSILALIFLLSYILYSAKTHGKKTFFFIVGAAIGISPLMLYNYVIFQNPFIISRMYISSSVQIPMAGFLGLTPPNPFVALRLLFYPSKGLFFYYPVLIFSIPGLYKMWKNRAFREESILFVLLFSLVLIFNSSWSAWNGVFFGPKFLTLLQPFIVLPIALVIDSVSKRRTYYFLLILLALSVMTNFVGLQPNPLEVLGSFELESPEYTERLNSFDIISNPIFEYYYPQTLLLGPRSRIVEDLLVLRIPDIRYNVFQNREIFPPNQFYIPYLPLILLTPIAYLIFRKNLARSPFNNDIRVILLLFILSGFLVDYIGPQEKGWNPKAHNEEGSWMVQNGTLEFISSGNLNRIEFSAILSSYNVSRQVHLYLNDELIETFSVSNEQNLQYSFILNPKSGLNTVKLHVDPGCLIPQQVEKINDTRCLSLHLWNYSFEPLTENYLFAERWYTQAPNEGGRWMMDNATIVVFPENQTFTLKVSGFSTWKTRELDVYQDGEYKTTWNFLKESTTQNNLTTTTNQQEYTTLLLVSKQECTIPTRMPDGWNDARCLAVQFTDIGVEILS